MVKKYFADDFIQHNPNLAGGTPAIENMVTPPRSTFSPACSVTYRFNSPSLRSSCLTL
jgi:hypothetical protein